MTEQKNEARNWWSWPLAVFLVALALVLVAGTPPLERAEVAWEEDTNADQPAPISGADLVLNRKIQEAEQLVASLYNQYQRERGGKFAGNRAELFTALRSANGGNFLSFVKERLPKIGYTTSSRVLPKDASISFEFQGPGAATIIIGGEVRVPVTFDQPVPCPQIPQTPTIANIAELLNCQVVKVANEEARNGQELEAIDRRAFLISGTTLERLKSSGKIATFGSDFSTAYSIQMNDREIFRFNTSTSNRSVYPDGPTFEAKTRVNLTGFISTGGVLFIDPGADKAGLGNILPVRVQKDKMVSALGAAISSPTPREAFFESLGGVRADQSQERGDSCGDRAYGSPGHYTPCNNKVVEVWDVSEEGLTWDYRYLRAESGVGPTYEELGKVLEVLGYEVQRYSVRSLTTPTEEEESAVARAISQAQTLLYFAHGDPDGFFLADKAVFRNRLGSDDSEKLCKTFQRHVKAFYPAAEVDCRRGIATLPGGYVVGRLEIMAAGKVWDPLFSANILIRTVDNRIQRGDPGYKGFIYSIQCYGGVAANLGGAAADLFMGSTRANLFAALAVDTALLVDDLTGESLGCKAPEEFEQGGLYDCKERRVLDPGYLLGFPQLSAQYRGTFEQNTRVILKKILAIDNRNIDVFWSIFRDPHRHYRQYIQSAVSGDPQVMIEFAPRVMALSPDPESNSVGLLMTSETSGAEGNVMGETKSCEPLLAHERSDFRLLGTTVALPATVPAVLDSAGLQNFAGMYGEAFGDSFPYKVGFTVSGLRAPNGVRILGNGAAPSPAWIYPVENETLARWEVQNGKDPKGDLRVDIPCAPPVACDLPRVSLVNGEAQENGRSCVPLGVSACRVGTCKLFDGNGTPSLQQGTDMTEEDCVGSNGARGIFKEFRGEPLIGGHCGVGPERVFKSRQEYEQAQPPSSLDSLDNVPSGFMWTMTPEELRSLCQPGQVVKCGLRKELRIERPIDEHTAEFLPEQTVYCSCSTD